MGFSVDLSPNPADVVWDVAMLALGIAVAVASFRRSRLLSGYPIWRSVVIAFLAGSFPWVWFTVSVVNRDRIAGEWKQYKLRSVRSEPSADLGHDQRERL